VVKVSVIGIGMRSHAGIAATAVSRRSRKKGINIRAITTSEIKISVLIDSAYASLRCGLCIRYTVWTGSERAGRPAVPRGPPAAHGLVPGACGKD
jgi:hypothetical protein